MKVMLKERKETGKKISSMMRESGFVPVVCYGHNFETKLYSIYKKTAKQLLSASEVVFEADGDLKNKSVLIKDYQVHPVTEEILHIDFMVVSAAEKVEHEVSIKVVGEAPAVKTKEGVLVIVLDAVSVRALPSDLINEIEVDVSSLEEIGSHILAKDLKFGDKFELLVDEEEPILTIVKQADEEVEEVPEKTDMDAIGVVGKQGEKESEEGEGEEQV